MVDLAEEVTFLLLLSLFLRCDKLGVGKYRQDLSFSVGKSRCRSMTLA